MVERDESERWGIRLFLSLSYARAVQMAEDQLESLLFVAREVYVYQVSTSRTPRSTFLHSTRRFLLDQIPPRQSNAGYRAADWQSASSVNLDLESRR